MSDQYLAEIRMFAFNFAPAGWALCNGQILPIQQYTALFSLLGVTYGGNGTSNFALPNLQGSAALHVGRNQPGPGLSIYDLGQVGGTPTVTLLQTEMPMHSHALSVTGNNGTLTTPANNQLAKAYTGNFQQNSQGAMYATGPANLQMLPQSISVTGNNQPHNNVMPSLTVSYCIAMQGNFPARN